MRRSEPAVASRHLCRAQGDWTPRPNAWPPVSAVRYLGLLYWRPVPGFEPSPSSFSPSREFNERARSFIVAAVERGELGPEATSDAAMALFTCLLSGVVTQQLANEPRAAFENGRFTRHTAEAFSLFVSRYGTPATVAARPQAGDDKKASR